MGGRSHLLVAVTALVVAVTGLGPAWSTWLTRASAMPATPKVAAAAVPSVGDAVRRVHLRVMSFNIQIRAAAYLAGGIPVMAEQGGMFGGEDSAHYYSRQQL